MNNKIKRFEFMQSESKFEKKINNNSPWNFYESKDLKNITLAVQGYELKLTNKIIIYGTESKNQYNGNNTIWVNRQEVDFDSPEYTKCVLSEVKGISIDKANEIVENSGVTTISELLESINSGEKIKGIGEKRKELIREKLIDIENDKLFSELHMILDNVKWAEKVKDKIINIQELYDNPYEILKSLRLGFQKIDEIARTKLNISLDNKNRIDYLVEYKFNQFNVKQSNYIGLDEFIDYLMNEVRYIKGDINTFLKENELLVIDGKKVYLKPIFEAESETPSLLLKNMDLNISNVPGIIESLEYGKKFKLTEKQKESIIEIVNNDSMSILTGEAGTGKSTITKYICETIETRYPLLLLSPTGKAAGRMRECTGMDANTIHSFIYFINSDFANAHITYSKYGIMDDFVLIIDEVSMVDQVLFYHLLSSIADCSFLNLKKIIIIGDPYQLPSVGCGQVLVDLINSKCFHHIHLTEVQRQKCDSNIVVESKKVRNKKVIDSSLRAADFYVTELNPDNLKRLYGHFCKLYEHNQLDIYKNVQICTSTNRKREEINNYFKINGNENRFGFQVGDKVINLQNDRERGISNGDFGIVEHITRKEIIVYFFDIEKRVTFDLSEKKQLTHAYACTIHKLQGSEYKTIIIILENSQAVSNYRSLYTAITRGKTNVIILAKSPKDIKEVCQRDYDYRRKTFFVKRLQSFIGK